MLIQVPHIVANLLIDESRKMLSDNHFKPSNWMFHPVDENLRNAILDFFKQHNDIFRLTQNDLLAERMSVLINSQEFHGDNCLDFIDSLIKKNTR